MATIVLVPGAYHGGWYFSPIVPQLRSAGHDVHTITLSGLRPSNTSVASFVNLQTHIDDLVQLIDHERIDDICLVGHSYAGMVIAGAASRLLGRIRTLVFIDAMVPQDGDSVWSIWPPGIRDAFIGASTDGVFTGPPSGLDPRTMAQPLATLLQPISLAPGTYGDLNKVYAWCSVGSGAPFETTYEACLAADDWKTNKLPCGHDIMGEAPQVAYDLISQSAAL